jgi:hypothetical protein
VTPPALAWLELIAHNVAACAIWRREPGTAVTSRSRGRVAIAGDLIVADAAVDDEELLARADVIINSGSASQAVPVQWLSSTLHAFPGSAVTAIWTAPGICTIAMRQDTIVISLPGGGGLCSGWRLLAGAAMVHGWLSARLPVASLALGSVELRGPSGPASSGTPRMPGIMPIPFTMFTAGVTPE